MKHLNVPQWSDLWFQARLGIPTSSDFDKIFTPKTLGISKSADKYLYRLLAESKLQCSVEPDIVAWAVQRGKDLEGEAVAFYELTRDVQTQECGFILSDDERYGASPDRLVGEEGILEIKAPLANTHLQYLVEGVLPQEYFLQVHGQLLVTGCKYAEFLSYFPGLPAFLLRVEPDLIIQQKLHEGLTAFCDRLDVMKLKLTAMYES